MANPISQGGKWPLRIQQGADLDITFEYRDAGGTLIPLTGYTAKGQIRSKEDVSGTLYADLTCTVTDPGEVRIQLTSAETADIPKSGFYDIFLIAPGLLRYLFLQGEAVLDKSVTDFP